MLTGFGGELVLGTARVVVQDHGELTPRVTECPIVATDWLFRRIIKRLWKKFLRRMGPYAAMLAIGMMVAQGLQQSAQLNHFPMVMGVITSAVANSFKIELGTGTHNFTNGTGNTFKCALYTSTATLGSGTTAYAVTNEITGTNYTAGGATITSSTPVLSGSTAIWDFTDAQWTTATFTANGCLVYNASAGNKAVFVIAFGADQTVTAGTFTIQWPTPDAANAILRLA